MDKKEKQKEYRKNNKEIILEKKKEYTKCRSCGLFQTRKENNWLCSYCNPNKSAYKKNVLKLNL